MIAPTNRTTIITAFIAVTVIILGSIAAITVLILNGHPVWAAAMFLAMVSWRLAAKPIVEGKR